MSASFSFPVPAMPAVHPETSGLLAQLQAAGLPAVDVQTSQAYPGQVIVVCSSDVDTAAQTQMGNVVAAWDPRPRVKRPLYAVFNDLVALTATQQGNIWADLSAGTPPKYLLDAGTNAAALAALDWVVRASGVTGAALLGARLRVAAMYAQDNVSYLVTPAFDATVNVPGDMS